MITKYVTRLIWEKKLNFEYLFDQKEYYKNKLSANKQINGDYTDYFVVNVVGRCNHGYIYLWTWKTLQTVVGSIRYRNPTQRKRNAFLNFF